MTSIGVQVGGAPLEPVAVVEAFVSAEAAGVDAAWLVQATAGGDALSILSAAAVRTTTIELGMSVLPMVGRHPLVAASQALTVARLSGDRLRLGLGTSHRHIAEQQFGIPFSAPREQLREYTEIVGTLLRTGQVDYAGEHWSAQATATPCEVPIYLGALGPSGFRLAGEISDGAVSWLCPSDYLRDVARPALDEGARIAARPRPRLIAHLLVAVTDDIAAARSAAARRIAPNLQMTYYARVLDRAGLEPSAPGGELRAVDAMLLAGPAQAVTAGLRERLDGTVDELLVTPVPLGGDATTELEAVFAAIAACR